MTENGSYMIYFVITIVVFLLFYYILYKVSNALSFAPEKITMDDINNLKRRFGKRIKIGHFKSHEGETLWYALYNKYREPSWDENITFYCHGNGGWIGGSVDGSYFDELSRFGSIFIFDYRGYGMSSGSPTESGIYADTESAWDFLTNKKHVDINKIIIFGHSLGTSTSSYMMNHLHRNGRKLPKYLILSAPFYNFTTISTDLFPGIGRFNVNTFETNEYLKNIKGMIKVLYIHSKNDEMIHTYHSQKLHGECPGDLYIIDGTHNDPLLSNDAKLGIYKAYKSLDA